VVLGWLLLVATLVVAQPVRAQEEPSASPENVEAARVLAKEGLAAVKEGRFDQAVPILSRSLELHRAPFTLYTLGLAYRGAKRPAAALESFRQFLALPSSEAMKPYEQPAREAVAELEQIVAHVTISVSPAGVNGMAIRIDDEELPPAALGLPRLVDPGPHVIEVTAPGYLPAREDFEIASQASRTVELSLDPDPEAATPGVEADDGGGMLVAQIVLIGAGTVALGAGITVGLLGYTQAKDARFNDDPDAEAAKTKALVGDVLAISGGVVAGAGLIWLLVDVFGAEDDGDAQAIRPWCDSGALGVQLAF
jgi:hypothetical protein